MKSIKLCIKLKQTEEIRSILSNKKSLFRAIIFFLFKSSTFEDLGTSIFFNIEN
jgi:hypothetical protein